MEGVENLTWHLFIF